MLTRALVSLTCVMWLSLAPNVVFHPQFFTDFARTLICQTVVRILCPALLGFLHG